MTNIFSQDYNIVKPDSWNFISEEITSGFDKSAFIIGISNSPYVTSPVLTVNRINENPIRIYLTYFPAGICGDNTIIVKFNNEKTKYQISANYYMKQRCYLLRFNNILTVSSFINKLESSEYVYIRLNNECSDIVVEFSSVGAIEALKKLN